MLQARAVEIQHRNISVAELIQLFCSGTAGEVACRDRSEQPWFGMRGDHVLRQAASVLRLVLRNCGLSLLIAEKRL